MDINMKIILFWLITWTFIGCKEKTIPKLDNNQLGHNSIVIIDNKYQISKDTIKLSSISDSLFYISIRGNSIPEKLDIHKVMTTKEYIFIHGNHRFFQFNWNGDLIHEYRNAENDRVYGFDVLDQQNILFIAFPNKILIHGFDGKLIKSVPLAPDLESIGYFFAAIDTNKMVLALMNKGHNHNRLVIINMNGEVIKKFNNTERFNSNNIPVYNASRFHRMITRNNTDIYYHPLYNDTIYRLIDYKLFPVFVEKKIFKVPLEERPEYTGDINRLNKYCNDNLAFITRTMVSNRYILIEAQKASFIKAFPTFMIYDWKIGKLYFNDLSIDFSKDKMHMGIFNDWDGGIAFKTEFIDNGYMIGYYDVNRFLIFNRDGYQLKSGTNTYKNYITCSHSISKQSRYNALKSFITKINNDEDKLVLMFAKLKE